ncbi:phosphoribosylanthranilate isomerase [Chryseobacterium indoltheticum]|uniref:N-(5'-phosphoribosyl)anthranilate isomerase n=1 Tax=Chryseobacterium indoltheticum TaxID=254 RepID=A0A381F441_9FLAO|nr:phosphoribosylanthranilate isomerase [Chryseobacterium indoltheticum]AZA74878.1 phosphoribosylanthranilate isomerase [Chryseobacterium indoltheticum]SIQ32044.1 phosphoribosylanthranilate isomerase [Chryseobacterium indoltheticum]SUX41321.1 N-(5'-phosphoribosyl)anthranilate isomerase [Chryseobacterium indoltheticum]
MIENQQPSTENPQPKLKICGLTQLSQIRELVALKIDFIGFIFYEKSPRYVLNHLNLDEISEINHQGKVGVFVNENIDKIIEFAEKADLNFIQLHGDESDDFILELRKKLNTEVGIIKVIRVGNQISDFRFQTQKIFDSAQTDNQQPTTINYLLFDTDSKAFGGTGKTFDWNILNEIKIPLPYFLSGGISWENFHQLKTINQQPFALDINSKFEIEPGIKDLEKIKEFLSLIKY